MDWVPITRTLPGFVVLTSGGRFPDAGKSVWGSGFLPSVYQGVQCRSEGDPVLFVKDPERHEPRSAEKLRLMPSMAMNRIKYQEYKDPEINSRISQYEMAYRMQISVPRGNGHQQ